MRLDGNRKSLVKRGGDSLVHLVLGAAAKVFPFVGRWRRRKADQHARHALDLYLKGEAEAAILSYTNALYWVPQDANLLSALGQVYYEQVKYENAIEEFRKALDYDYYNHRALKGLALCLHVTGDQLEAIYTYLRVLDVVPDDLDVLVNVGALLHDRQRYDEAVEYYTKAEKLNPENAAIYLNLGLAYHSMGRFEDALTNLREASKLDPQSSETHRLIGLCLESTGNYVRALESYQQAVQHDEGNAEATLDIAQVLNVLKKPTEAIPYGLRAANKFREANDQEGVANAYWEVGWSHYLVGDWDASIKASREALRLSPALFPARFNLGLALLQMNQSSEARQEYEEAIDAISTPSDIKTYAVEDLKAALEGNPELPGAQEILDLLTNEYGRMVGWMISHSSPVADRRMQTF
jgi:tetratricopeptide (TPR) repeat protein